MPSAKITDQLKEQFNEIAEKLTDAAIEEIVSEIQYFDESVASGQRYWIKEAIIEMAVTAASNETVELLEQVSELKNRVRYLNKERMRPQGINGKAESDYRNTIYYFCLGQGESLMPGDVVEAIRETCPFEFSHKQYWNLMVDIYTSCSFDFTEKYSKANFDKYFLNK